jgi:hypothetical protein
MEDMMLKAKWTAVSFFAVAALGAASVAFAGCTVTSGTVDDREGGTGTNTDSGTSTGDSATDSPVVNACPGNTRRTIEIVDATCQAALDEECCAEQTACFNIVPDQDAAAGGTDDCNAYTKCIALCNGEPDDNKKQLCYGDCDAASQKTIADAYDALVACISNPAHTKSLTACQK